MRKVTSDLSAPAVCVICRHTRIQPGEFMIETGALNDFGVQTPLSGQVYVCNACVDDLAQEAGGFVKEADVDRERGDYEATREELRVVFTALDAVGRSAVDARNLATRLDERLAKREAEGSG